VLTKEHPDHHDAELVLRLYDLRREPTMRESRSAVHAKYWPKNADEAVAVLESGHPINAAFRQVVTYWEMVYGMAKWGIIHADFMIESSSEGLLVFAKAEPHLDRIRQSHPTYFTNTEWVVEHSAVALNALERYRARVKRVLESK
jgi:hypothetical protein